MPEARRSVGYAQPALWDKFWKDRRGNVVIWQRPSGLLISWAAISVISLFVPYGWPATAAWILSAIVLGAWSLLEIFRGVNYFRRALGAVVLLMLIAAAFKLA